MAAQRIAAASSSLAKVILIGSYARADATVDSDVDLLVLQKEFDNKAEEYLQLIEQIRLSLPWIDLILMSEDDFEWRSLMGNTLPYWAKKEGRILLDFN